MKFLFLIGQDLNRRLPFKEVGVLSTLLSVTFVLLYKKYLFDDALYLFGDIGRDTIDTYWPLYYYYTGVLREHGIIFWSHSLGMGTSIFSVSNLLFDPFNIIFYAVGKDNLARALIYVCFAKTFFSGLFFYLYLIEVRVSKFTALVLALTFAFNGFLVLWGQHYHFATAIVLSAFMMYGVERWIQRGKPLVFICSTAIFCSITVYFFWMISVYLALYVPFRYWTLHHNFTSKVFYSTAKSFFYYLLGVGLSSVLLFPRVYVLLTSYRSSSVAGNLTIGEIFKFATLEYYLGTILRFFSNDLTGSAANFFGYLNYYELPILYCGTLTTLLFPLLFFFTDKKVRIPYLLFFFIMVSFLVFPFFSALMHGFGKFSYNYRWTFLLVIFKLFYAAIALDYIVLLKQKPSWKAPASVIFFFILIVGAIYVGKTQLNWDAASLDIAKKEARRVLIYMCLFLPLIYLLRTKKWIACVRIGVIFIVVAELVSFANLSVNQRRFIRQTDLESRLYFDGTQMVTKKLKNKSPSFFRVGKKYDSVYLNDSVVQGYKGFKTYNSVNNPSYLRFIEVLELTPFHTTRISGLNEVLPLETLLGMKYFLSTDRYGAPYGYTYDFSEGNIHTFKNNYSLPVVFTYDNYMFEKKFNTLSAEQKYQMLLRAAVVESDIGFKRKKEDLNRNVEPNESTFQVPVSNEVYPDSGIQIIQNQYPSKYVFNA